jgi:sigma-B regulation protein RsbU (phosphoserine phosphatase)
LVGTEIAFVMACYLLGLSSLVLNAFASSPDTRRRTRVMLWGTLAAVVPAMALQIYAGATGRSYDKVPFWEWAPVVLALFLLPISFAYAVVKYRVMEIPVLLRRSARYVLVRQALVVFAGALAIVSTFAFARVIPWFAGSDATEPGSTPLAAVAGAGFGVVLAMAGGRLIRRGTERIDRAFFRGSYDARRILHELAARCRTASDPEQLASDVRRALDDALHARAIHVLLRTASGGLALAGTPDSAAREVSDDADAVDLHGLFGGDAVRELAPPFEGVPPWLAAIGPELVVALEGRDERLEGLFALEPRLSEEPYSHEDRELLAAIGSQAGIALENIRLAREMVTRAEAERRVNLELAIAKQVQARLLPQQTPSLGSLDYAGACVQAREVGGDYFDFVQLDEGRLALVLADIAGKGISAALLMASLQAMLRTRASQAARDLPGMLCDVNQVFYDSTAANNYATLFFGIFDERDRSLTYANCGHLPPVLHRASGGAERLACTAAVMGLFSPWPCAASVVRLDPGDTLVVFTDGATDALDTAGNEFGEDRVLDLIARHVHLDAHRLLQAIVRHVQDFSGPAPFDDLTLLVAKVRS